MNTEREINERKNKWNALLSGAENARNLMLIHCTEGLEPAGYVTDGHYETASDRALKKYEIMTENIAWLHDDSVPYLDMTTGTEIFAESFGCRVIYPGNNNPFALPKLESLSEIPALKVPDLWQTRLADLFETAFRLREKAGRNAVLKLPDIQSPLDIAALILKKEEFFAGMIDDPQAIRELIRKTHTLLERFLDEWFKEFGKEFVAHFPDYYMEYGVTLSEDEIGSFGSGMFSVFVSDELNALSDRYGRIGIHCCANARHQWENLKRINNLCCLNLCQPPEIIREAYGFFRDTCCQMHSFYEGPVESWRERYRNELVVFQIYVQNREEALRIQELLKDR